MDLESIENRVPVSDRVSLTICVLRHNHKWQIFALFIIIDPLSQRATESFSMWKMFGKCLENVNVALLENVENARKCIQYD